ncbi:hypothetical protein LCGC14_0340910 [marine sediment metagenome]|uniref:Uncharacterized protein n=1 Tax=marine sediment metagenome TaxID=412755 RepID=A0A0F9TJ77_9ZZZZ
MEGNKHHMNSSSHREEKRKKRRNGGAPKWLRMRHRLRKKLVRR